MIFHISPLLSMGPFLWAWHPISTAALVQCPPIAGNVQLKYDYFFEKLDEPIPDYYVLFCPEYCDILIDAVVLRLSDTHEKMVASVSGTVELVKHILTQFKQPPSNLFEEWSDVAMVQIESLPSTSLENQLKILSQKTKSLTKWLKEALHPALRQVIKPVIVLAVNAILVRFNALCQAYTGHATGEYLGHACLGLFDSGCFDDLVYTALHLAVLNLLPSTYRVRGTPPTEQEVEIMRVACHKMDVLLLKLPTTYESYDLIKEHYGQSIKVTRELCAKVVSGYTGSYDLRGSLSELELVFLDAASKPKVAIDVATKYMTDITKKIEEQDIDFMDAENMLYLTGKCGYM